MFEAGPGRRDPGGWCSSDLRRLCFPLPGPQVLPPLAPRAPATDPTGTSAQVVTRLCPVPLFSPASRVTTDAPGGPVESHDTAPRSFVDLRPSPGTFRRVLFGTPRVSVSGYRPSYSSESSLSETTGLRLPEWVTGSTGLRRPCRSVTPGSSTSFGGQLKSGLVPDTSAQDGCRSPTTSGDGGGGWSDSRERWFRCLGVRGGGAHPRLSLLTPCRDFFNVRWPVAPVRVPNDTDAPQSRDVVGFPLRHLSLPGRALVCRCRSRTCGSSDWDPVVRYRRHPSPGPRSGRA